MIAKAEGKTHAGKRLGKPDRQPEHSNNPEGQIEVPTPKMYKIVAHRRTISAK
jgi:hypothetical protein